MILCTSVVTRNAFIEQIQSNLKTKTKPSGYAKHMSANSWKLYIHDRGNTMRYFFCIVARVHGLLIVTVTFNHHVLHMTC